MEKVYISDSDLNNLLRARKYQHNGEWDNAKQLHKAMGNTKDVEAINLIQKATSLGDEYRALAKPINEAYEQRKLNIYQYQEQLNGLY
jgi:hypothetical protein